MAGLGGRIVKTMGDGLLLEFPSVVAAVECAIAIQKLMAERNADAPEAKRIVYRIGVSLGDVLIEGDDILGDGVNIAARLEGICEPGQVLISSTAFENVRGKIDANFVDLGDKMAWAELGLGHFDAAIEESSKAIDVGSKAWFTYLCLATAHGLKGDIDDAKAPWRKRSDSIPNSASNG